EPIGVAYFPGDVNDIEPAVFKRFIYRYHGTGVPDTGTAPRRPKDKQSNFRREKRVCQYPVAFQVIRMEADVLLTFLQLVFSVQVSTDHFRVWVVREACSKCRIMFSDQPVYVIIV